MSDFKFEIPAKPNADDVELSERHRFALPITGTADSGYWLYEPTPEQVAMFAKVGSRMAMDADRLYGAWEFVQAITDQLSFSYLRNRYLDADDPFDNEALASLLNAVADYPVERLANNRAAKRAVAKKSKA